MYSKGMHLSLSIDLSHKRFKTADRLNLTFGSLMKTLIEQIVAKLHKLPEPNVREVLDFVEILAWYRGRKDLLQATQSASLRERATVPHDSTAADVDRVEHCDD